MKLQISLVLFLQVLRVKCLPDISGFLGDNVTLPSGVNSSWELSSIEWLIFSNSTRIATYSEDGENLNRLDRYTGRLGLDSSTGDLTIHHLTSEDALQYTVDLTSKKRQNIQNKVTVRVMKRLQKPTVEVFESKSTRCHWSVRCQSTDKGVHLSWEAPPPAVTSSYNLTDADGLSVALLDFKDSTQNLVNVTCVSQRGREKTSGSVTVTCHDDELKPTPPPTPQHGGRTRYGIGFAVWLLLAVLWTVVLLWLFNRYNGNIL